MADQQQGGNGPADSASGPDGRVQLVADLDRPGSWMLLADGIPQSHVDLDNPRHLELEYVRRLGHVIDLAAPAGMPLRVLHLGGGALTLARYVAATRPGSGQLVAESSAQVARLVRERLPLRRASWPPDEQLPDERIPDERPPDGWPPDGWPPGELPRTGSGRISVLVADARTIAERVPAGSFDLLIADVFGGGQTPAHLTSAEFTAAAARALAPAGSYAVNIADGPPLAHARGRVAAVGSVFRHVAVIAEAAVLDGASFGNLIAVASGHPLPVAELARLAAADPVPARLLHGAALIEFVAGTRPVTDANAVPSPLPPPQAYA